MGEITHVYRYSHTQLILQHVSFSGRDRCGPPKRGLLNV